MANPGSTQGFGLVFTFLHVSLALWDRNERDVWTLEGPPLANFKTVFQITAASCVIPISVAEHRRSLRPSSLLICYLLGIMAQNMMMKLTTWSQSVHDPKWSWVFALAFMGSQITLEARSKRSLLKNEYQQLPPELTVSFISRFCLLWLHPYIVRGHGHVLTSEDLPALADGLRAGQVRDRVSHMWEKRGPN